MEWEENKQYKYPAGFTYKTKWIRKRCPTTGVRVIVTNGVPNHKVTMGFESRPCEVPWYIEIPLSPTARSSGDNATALGTGIIGAALNGVPFWSAGGEGGNTVLNDDVTLKQKYSNYWSGSSGSSGPTSSCQWRYTALLAESNVSNFDTGHVGYALDGFPIYQPVSDAATSRLDECNFDSGNQRYYMRTRAQVNETDSCAAATKPGETPWKYILGCYVGNASASKVESCAGKAVTTSSGPYDDCVLEAQSADWEDNFCNAEVLSDCKPKWFERSMIRNVAVFFLVLILLACLMVEMYKLYNRHTLKQMEQNKEDNKGKEAVSVDKKKTMVV
jgi:hypothetical protein